MTWQGTRAPAATFSASHLGLAWPEQSRAELTLDNFILSFRIDSWAGPKRHGWPCPHLLLAWSRFPSLYK